MNFPDEIDEKEIPMIIASQLYAQGKLSSGHAADLVGLSKKTFIELLGKYGVSVFSPFVEDLRKDIKNIEEI